MNSTFQVISFAVDLFMKKWNLILSVYKASNPPYAKTIYVRVYMNKSIEKRFAECERQVRLVYLDHYTFNWIDEFKFEILRCELGALFSYIFNWYVRDEFKVQYHRTHIFPVFIWRFYHSCKWLELCRGVQIWYVYTQSIHWFSHYKCICIHLAKVHLQLYIFRYIVFFCQFCFSFLIFPKKILFIFYFISVPEHIFYSIFTCIWQL